MNQQGVNLEALKYCAVLCVCKVLFHVQGISCSYAASQLLVLPDHYFDGIVILHLTHVTYYVAVLSCLF